MAFFVYVHSYSSLGKNDKDYEITAVGENLTLFAFKTSSKLCSCDITISCARRGVAAFLLNSTLSSS